MRIANAVHEAQPWVINDIASDFTLLDVWALPVEGDRNEFPAVLDVIASLDPLTAGSTLSRVLFWVRSLLGELLGWDETKEWPVPGRTETTLAARLPEGLRGSAASRALPGGFTPLYATDREWAAEISNQTVHGVLHVAWVEQDGERHRAHMAVYVKTRGALGRAYLALIQPFRHVIVYPALTRAIGRAWNGRAVADR